MTDMTVKFAEGSDTIIEGLGVPFGLDLDGQQFSAKSDLCLDWFPNGGRPILYHHGFDDTVKMVAIGHELESTMTDEGLWVRAELDKHSKYYKRVKELIDKDALGWSSGAPDHKVKVAKSGHIDRWPPVEYSLTPTPSKPNQVAFAMKTEQVNELMGDLDIQVPGLIEQAHEGDSEPETLAEHSEAVLAGVKVWGERLDEKVDFRLLWKERDAALPASEQARKSGRVLSILNLNALDEVIRLLTDVRARATAPEREEEAEAAKSSLELTLALTDT